MSVNQLTVALGAGAIHLLETRYADTLAVVVRMKEERPIPVYDHLTYSDFLSQHLLPNTPFLLSASSTANWPSRIHWNQESSGGPSKPNYNALRKYGNQIVPVADTTTPEYGEFRRSERPLGEVLDLWESGAGEGLYVKDWHLLAELESQGKGAGEVYEVPECFRDDWLNPPYSPHPRASSTSSSKIDTSTSDFRFTYLGPPGTYTPLHRDVYSSYSWSCNILGRKVWWLFPPDRVSQVMKNGEPIFDVREVGDEGGGIKVVQEEGEVIWVPSGWYHQVLNLDFCISINHNFFSSPTLPAIFSALEISQIRVENSIQDVKEMIISRLGDGWKKEWVEEVQGLLERDAGWGWRGFWECVERNIDDPPMELDDKGRTARDGFIHEIIGRYKKREEWEILDDVRMMVDSIESRLRPISTT